MALSSRFVDFPPMALRSRSLASRVFKDDEASDRSDLVSGLDWERGVLALIITTQRPLIHFQSCNLFQEADHLWVVFTKTYPSNVECLLASIVRLLPM
jgi:hypothetical protein